MAAAAGIVQRDAARRTRQRRRFFLSQGGRARRCELLLSLFPSGPRFNLAEMSSASRRRRRLNARSCFYLLWIMSGWQTYNDNLHNNVFSYYCLDFFLNNFAKISDLLFLLMLLK